jgi:mannonate dehydratase
MRLLPGLALTRPTYAAPGLDRRSFGRLAGSGLLGALTGGSATAYAREAPASAAPARPRALMKVGTQHGSSDDVLAVLAAFGVDHICAELPSVRLDESWSLESLRKVRERVESFGLHLDMLPLPMSSHPIAQAEYPSLLLGASPDRERGLDDVCRMIRATAEAGIPALKYNLTFLGAQYSTFSYAKARQEPPLTEAGPVPADLYWERITYFLDRVVPVAEEHKVRLACHPQDPGMPPGKGYRGVETVLGSVDGLKRFVSIRESPYHGLNFCQGTISEMLQDPGKEIFDVIRWFGTRKKIFNVHFRNIQGRFLDFRETFIDDGDVDMLAALRVYREVGYDGMMMPDHVPAIAGDEKGRQAFAFTFGYIKALIRALDAESA